MIALHFRDSPGDLLPRPSRRSAGQNGDFGGPPLRPGGNPSRLPQLLMRTAPLSIHSFLINEAEYNTSMPKSQELFTIYGEFITFTIHWVNIF